MSGYTLALYIDNNDLSYQNDYFGELLITITYYNFISFRISPIKKNRLKKFTFDYTMYIYKKGNNYEYDKLNEYN